MFNLDTNATRAKFEKQDVDLQCTWWNQYIEDADLFILPNDTVENRMNALNDMASFYDLEPCDMYMMGACNSEIYNGGKYMFFDAEDKSIRVVNRLEDCFNEDTIEDFFLTLEKWIDYGYASWRKE